MAITVPSTDKRGASNSRVSFVRDLAPSPLCRPLLLSSSALVFYSRVYFPSGVSLPPRPVPSLSPHLFPLPLALFAVPYFLRGIPEVLTLILVANSLQRISPVTFSPGKFPRAKVSISEGKVGLGAKNFLTGLKTSAFCTVVSSAHCSYRRLHRDISRKRGDYTAFGAYDEADGDRQKRLENGRGRVGRSLELNYRILSEWPWWLGRWQADAARVAGIGEYVSRRRDHSRDSA